MKFLLTILLALFSIALASEIDWSKVVDAHRRLPSENAGIGSRIVNGREAIPNQFPFQVALLSDMGGSGMQALCGGSIIARRTILTAAHCFVSDGILSSYTNVIAGAHNINRNEVSQVRMTVRPPGIIVHEAYNDNTMLNDIALVILPRQLIYNAYIQPVLGPTNLAETFEGMQSTVAGWGRMSDHSEATSDVLRTTTTRIISFAECRQYWGNIQPSNICDVGNSRQGTCVGDSGGPVTIVRGSTRYIVGLVSFGGEQCESFSPSVNTRVTSYMGWINARIAN